MTNAHASSNRARGLTSTTRDPVKTKRSILEAAVTEFAREGYAGGRVDRICKAANVNDRMLYYYFDSKERLWLAVLEKIYEEHTNAERDLRLPEGSAIASLNEIVSFNWNYYKERPEFISLLAHENLLRGRNLKKSLILSDFSSPMIQILQKVLSAGVRSGEFRGDVSVEHLFLTVCSVTYFYQANIFTLSNYLNRDLGRLTTMDAWLEHAKQVVVNSVLAINSETK